MLDGGGLAFSSWESFTLPGHHRHATLGTPPTETTGALSLQPGCCSPRPDLPLGLPGPVCSERRSDLPPDLVPNRGSL